MSKIGLIIEREFTQRVRKRSFLLVTFLTPLAMVALVVAPVLIAKYAGDEQKREIVVNDGSGVVAAAIENTDNLTFIVDSVAHDAAIDKYPAAYGFLEIGGDIVENPASLKLYTRQASTMGVEQAIKRQISQIIKAERIARTGIVGLDSLMHTLDAHASLQTFQIGEAGTIDSAAEKSSAMATGVAYAASLLIYMFVLIYGMMVLQGVVEEKSSRIIEVMVSSVRPFELMMGKILGIALVALLQFLLWVAVGVGVLMLLPAIDPSIVASAANGAGGGAADAMAGAVNGGGGGGALSMLFDGWFMLKMVGGFLIFFIGGYLLYASMFAAIGSAVDSVGDTQQLQVPVTIPLIISIVVMVNVMTNPYSSAAFWFSIIPLTSPIIMVARLAYGVPLWEFLLSVGLLYGSFVGMTWVAAKIYRTGIFMYGKKPSLAEIIRWARYKS